MLLLSVSLIHFCVATTLIIVTYRIFTRDLQKVSALLYFRRKWKGIGGIVGCRVTSRQDKPLVFAVSVRVCTKQCTWQ
jgi:hypothetical protein